MILFQVLVAVLGITLVQASDKDDIQARLSKIEAQLQTCQRRFEYQDELDKRVLDLEKHLKTSTHQQEDTYNVDSIRTHSKYTTFKDKAASKIRKRSTSYEGKRRKRSIGSLAFTAKVSRELTGLPIGRTIVFDHSITYTADYYSNETGIFTCPVAGLYLFAIFVESSVNREAVVELKRDGRSEVSAVSEPSRDGEDDTGGNIVLLPLEVGDRVWVETINVDNQSLWPHYTTFSGVLIYRD